MLRVLLLPAGSKPPTPGRGAGGPSLLPGGLALVWAPDCEGLGGKSNSRQPRGKEVLE